MNAGYVWGWVENMYVEILSFWKGGDVLLFAKVWNSGSGKSKDVENGDRVLKIRTNYICKPV
jgi:hypothetical protein